MGLGEAFWGSSTSLGSRMTNLEFNSDFRRPDKRHGDLKPRPSTAASQEVEVELRA